ncbi:MAG: hypothetical protein OEZ38_03680 [Gammaproteobacteria bacterium]|nr:hypothetical protein [Gammaproteobacteria bacterium]
MARAGLIIFCLLIATSIQARDFEGSYAVYGAGAKTCAGYLNAVERGGADQDYFIDWVIGYLSAFNVIMPDTYDILGESEFLNVQHWLGEHCQKFPRELFIKAVVRMTEILYPTRYQSGLKNPVSEPAKKSVASPRLKDIKIQ